MPHHIHIFGASGSGATTLGTELAKRIDAPNLDTDAYYWTKTDPPFTNKNRPADRVAMIENDIKGIDNWVLSGSICSWGNPLLNKFTLAVFLQLPNALRMERILNRERTRFGKRIDVGGDMHEAHIKFIDWANSYDHAVAPTRSLDLHEKWMKRLSCPILRLDSTVSVDELCDAVISSFE